VVPARSADDVRIETYSGPRFNLRPLFELAEDSAAELDSYIESGRASGCDPSSGTPSPPPPAIRPVFASTASS
jgi:hypothetical protein